MWVIFFVLLMIFSCEESRTPKGMELSKELVELLNAFPQKLVIAHRGTTFWAPEETEAAMRWARNIGVHYLEFDLQRTKDGYLIALHDNSLERTTNIAEVFPSRSKEPVSAFTYRELLALDAGSWFNHTYKERARSGFVGLDILTLEDIIQIAEGNKIKRDGNGKRSMEISKNGRIKTHYEKDPTDNRNRPGIYPETKNPTLFPGIEADLRAELEKLGWYNLRPEKLKQIETYNDKISIANTKVRVILQTFSQESLVKLKKTFERPIPTCFLLWRGNEQDDIQNDLLATFENKVHFGINNGANILGPSISGAPNNYSDLLTDAHCKIISKTGAHIHAYSFDTKDQLSKYMSKVNGVFSNKAEDALQFFHPTTSSSKIEEEWIGLGYKK